MSAIVVFGGQVSGKLMSDVGVEGQMSDCVPVVCGATRLSPNAAVRQLQGSLRKPKNEHGGVECDKSNVDMA